MMTTGRWEFCFDRVNFVARDVGELQVEEQKARLLLFQRGEASLPVPDDSMR